MPAWIPFAIKLIREWVKEGEPEKGDIVKLYDELKKLDASDIYKFGSILEISGTAIMKIAEIMSLDEKVATPTDPEQS